MSTLIESGLRNEEYEVYVTDRNLSFMEPLDDAVIDVRPNWDIDRAGSKGRVTITTQYGVLKPNMWIAVFAVHTPEVGDIQRFPYGHFRLGLPGQVHDGLYELDIGELSQIQDADGSDIVNDLADVRLTETFYTPRRGHIMTDVYNLIKMGTMGVIGPNILTNGSFESDGSGWVGGYDNGGNGSVSYTNNSVGIPFDAPDRDKFAQVAFAPSQPTNATRWWAQTSPIPANAHLLYCSGVAMQRGAARPTILLRFANESGATIGQSSYRGGTVSRFNEWVRHLFVTEVMEGAASVTTIVGWVYDSPGPSWNESYAWDDIRVGTCTAMPLPDERISLPISLDIATTRIQTSQGKNLLYDGINGDRLSAISYQALHTFLDGRLTTAPSRTLTNTTPRHVYGPDSELLTDDSITIQSTDGNVPNHFIAVKESHEEDVLPLFAEAWNTNPDDEFSIVNNPDRVITAPEIHVPDAVDQQALQAAVDAARDRFSTQEAFTYTAFHDPDLTVFDVVEFTDPAYPRLLGRWLVESIDPDGTVMRVGVRRAVGGYEQ